MDEGGFKEKSFFFSESEKINLKNVSAFVLVLDWNEYPKHEKADKTFVPWMVAKTETLSIWEAAIQGYFD